MTWNFTKFLVNATGEVVKWFEPRTTPEEIEAQLDAFLDLIEMPIPIQGT
ncbi:MAG: hypothetical protein O7G83_11120 [Proteobacteria bacterium]|nr:hypothetical protein [Pseudomonadota bacterium]